MHFAAIWFLPTDNVYGGWPLSGEIDLVETRGKKCKSIKTVNRNVSNFGMQAITISRAEATVLEII